MKPLRLPPALPSQEIIGQEEMNSPAIFLPHSQELIHHSSNANIFSFSTRDVDSSEQILRFPGHDKLPR